MADEGTGGRAVAASEPIESDQAIPELQQLGPADETPALDETPAPVKRRRRSGTSGAERARRAKQAAGTPTDKAPRAPRRAPAKRIDIKAGMTQLYTMAGLAVSMVPTQSPVPQAVGLQMGAQAEQCAAAWEQLAKENPRVREALEQLLTVSSVGVLIAAHAPIVTAGAAAAGALPAGAVEAMGGQAAT